MKESGATCVHKDRFFDSLYLTWTLLELVGTIWHSLALPVTELNSLELIWNRFDSLGRLGLELFSIGLTLTRLKSLETLEFSSTHNIPLN